MFDTILRNFKLDIICILYYTINYLGHCFGYKLNIHIPKN